MGKEIFIKNELRNKNPQIDHIQPEYKRLNLDPLDMVKNKKINEIPSRRGISGKQMLPTQQKVSVGTHMEQEWTTSLDGNPIQENENFSDNKEIDNNDYVDVEALQTLKAKNIPNEAIASNIDENNDLQTEVGTYTVLFCGRMIASGISLSETTALIEEIFFDPQNTDLKPNDFCVFKRVEVRIGVNVLG